jgi:hypothetical protein
MSAWRRLNERERALIAFAVTFLAAVTVLLFGALTKRTELARKVAERDRLEATARPGAAPPDGEIPKLVARRAALRKAIDDDRRALAGLERSFPASQAKALEAVAALAAQLGVYVRESAPLAAESDALGRPRRRFVVVAAFGALRTFLAALPALKDGPVHAESLSIETRTLPDDGESGGEDVRVLVATLVLVL